MRQTDAALVVVDRKKSEGRRTPHRLEPEQLPGPIEPVSCKEGPKLHTGGMDGTGSEIRRH